MDVMQHVTEYLRKRPGELKKLKEGGGRKVVAYLAGDYVPAELIYAAGAVPVGLIHGGDPEPVEAAHRAILRYLCPFARAQFGYWVLKEQKYYELFDLMVAPISCQHLRRVADLYSVYTELPVFRLGVPQPYDGEHGVNYFKESLVLLKQRLEGLTGNEVTDKKLNEAIGLYNRIRGLLREISELRKSPRPPITTRDFIRLNHAAHLAAPEFVVEMLEGLYRELSQQEGPESQAPRLLISGPNIAMGDYKVLDVIEESGGRIVAEDIAEGVLFYWENVAVDGDPLGALATRHIGKRPNCAFIRPSLKRHIEFIRGLARDFKVDRIVWYQLRFCETWDMESYFCAEELKKLAEPIPMLKLDSEYDISDRGQLRTRVETFVETLREGRI